MFSITGQKKKIQNNTEKGTKKAHPAQTGKDAHIPKNANRNTNKPMPTTEPTALTIRTEQLLLFLFCFQFIFAKVNIVLWT